jgi:preprotein translocase subunit SecG
VEFIDVILAILNVVIVVLTLFLIGIILIQRGKGGGLAGAFGGMGGSSAFGTKTGDVFTKITVGVAIAWILLSMLMVVLTNRRNRSAWGDEAATSLTKELDASSSKSKAKDRDKAKAIDDIIGPSNAPSAVDGQPPIDIPAIPEIPLPAEKKPASAPLPAEKPAQAPK